jgi:hypothetical protein
VQLSQGSTTVLYVNTSLSPAQSNSIVLSQSQGFGGSFNFRSFQGATLVISNLGPALAAGQKFFFFGNYAGNAPGNLGLNTTNTFPVMQPAAPGPGLVWELSNIYIDGSISVLSASDPSLFFSITNNQFTINDNGTNKVVTDLTWTPNKTNAWVQQLTTGLTNGLTATNWINLNLNLPTNGTASYPSSSEYIVTNIPPLSPAVFYRLVWP